jgi:glycine cleavage system aminomethyltransferase T
LIPAARAIRTGVALSRLDHVLPLGVYGPNSPDVVDRLVPRALYLRDGGMAPTLLLDVEGHILADVTVVADDADFVLFVEGLDPVALLAHVQAQVLPGEEVELRPMWERYALFAVTGPYAWELMEELAGPEILGLPFLSAVVVGEDICLRNGKTGEWAYQLLVPDELAEERWGQLLRIGARFEAVEADRAALDGAALENGFFVVRVPGLRAMRPVEAQLQWCLTPKKDGYVGAEATRRSLEHPPTRRLTYALSEATPEVGAAVFSGATPVGVVAHAEPCTSRPGALVLLLLDLAYAQPGQDLDVGGVVVRTVSSPAVANLSLALDPQQHRFATRVRDFGAWKP